MVTTRYGTRPVKIEQLTGPYEPNGQPDPHLGQPLQLGLFAWNIQGGSTGSKAVLADPDRYQNYWKWPLASKLITEAERIGFDYQVPFARWIGQGGDTDWNETCLESLTAAAAASSITSRMLQFSTAHSNYEFHPFHFAKFGVTVDHISDGRWGLNMVTGYSAKEYAAFGHIEPPEHDESYRRADEFFTLVKALWASDVPIIFEGEYYQCYGAYVNPKPTRKPRPLLMQAGQSPVGIDFACRHAEWIFQIQPQIENYRTVAKDIHDKAASYGRRVLVA
ncbi:MAG: LLM class flavin-dependent oxidoreductase, partial [bacterium]|nr:LLM class flavin-dependent oxidoreductase [bacterium]